MKPGLDRTVLLSHPDQPTTLVWLKTTWSLFMDQYLVKGHGDSR